MIEKTELVITKWNYNPPVANPVADDEDIPNVTTLQVQRRRTATKKGLAFRFTSRFKHNDKSILEIVAEDSYVIDLSDVVDKTELLNMIRHSFSELNDKFEFRKLSTLLYNRNLRPIEEHEIDLDTILPLLD